jgi:hypothetical protein
VGRHELTVMEDIGEPRRVGLKQPTRSVVCANRGIIAFTSCPRRRLVEVPTPSAKLAARSGAPARMLGLQGTRPAAGEPKEAFWPSRSHASALATCRHCDSSHWTWFWADGSLYGNKLYYRPQP